MRRVQAMVGVPAASVVWIAIAAAGETGGAASDGDAGRPFTGDETTQITAFHNELRREVGVPPVTWSAELATFAQAWAEELATDGRMQHRPPDGPWAQRYGENLAIGFGDRMFQAGHYTQMVWRTTTHLGAGRATVQAGERKGWTIVVCNYAPAGNRRGQAAY